MDFIAGAVLYLVVGMLTSLSLEDVEEEAPVRIAVGLIWPYLVFAIVVCSVRGER